MTSTTNQVVPATEDDGPADCDDHHGGRPGGSVETAGRRAARHLRERILRGALEPGTRIQQESVARELGMSRIPVREALRELEAEGLIVLVAHGTARVSKLDLAEGTEIYKMREYLEPLAAREAAVRVSDEQIEELRALLRALDRVDYRSVAWLDLDRRFHLAMYRPCGLPRLLKTVDTFWNTTQQYRRAFTAGLPGAEEARASHCLQLDALARRDPEDAELFARLHIRRTRVQLAQHPELFERR